jgi:hypothetical protein
LNATLAFAEKLQVIAVLNGVEETLGWVDEPEARRLLEQRKVTLLGTGTKVRKLRYIDIKPGERISFARSELKHTRYSHNHETPDNPEKCWTLIRLPKHTQHVFMAVVSQVHGCSIVIEPRKRKRTHAPQSAERGYGSGRDDRRRGMGGVGRVSAVVAPKAA